MCTYYITLIYIIPTTIYIDLASGNTLQIQDKQLVTAIQHSYWPITQVIFFCKCERDKRGEGVCEFVTSANIRGEGGSENRTNCERNLSMAPYIYIIIYYIIIVKFQTPL